MTKIPSLPLYLSPLFILLPPCPHSCLGSHSLFLTFWWNNQAPSLCVIFNYSLLSQLCSVLGCCVTQGTERWESTASFCSAVPASCRKSLHLFFSDWHIPLLVLHIIIFPFPFIRHLWWLRLLLEQHQVLSCLLVLLPWFPVFLTPCYCTDITPILLARVLNTGSTPTVMSGMTERSNHLPHHDRRPQTAAQSLLSLLWQMFTGCLLISSYRFPTPSVCSSELGRIMIWGSIKHLTHCCEVNASLIMTTVAKATKWHIQTMLYMGIIDNVIPLNATFYRHGDLIKNI